jgi:hypothetical protein
MEVTKVELARTELEFMQRLLLDVQRRLGQPGSGEPADDETVAALELALAFLRWQGGTPPDLDVQVGLGAAVERKLGADGMCAYRQWRNERRKTLAAQTITP